MSIESANTDLELLLRRIIREESGLTPVTPADKWRGGELVLKPGREGLQEKSIPIETFFGKVVMVRNRLRVLGAADQRTGHSPGHQGQAAGLHHRILWKLDELQRPVRGGRGQIQRHRGIDAAHPGRLATVFDED